MRRFGLVMTAAALWAGLAAAQAPPAPEALAAPGLAGWRVDGANGCWIWSRGQGPAAPIVRWSGACAGGPASGPGTLEIRWTDNNEPRLDRFVGTLRDGRPEGHGVFVWANGTRHDGEWHGGLRQGLGITTWPDGDRYEGNWREDRPDGLGELLNSTGLHRGTWRAGCLHEGRRRVAVGRLISE